MRTSCLALIPAALLLSASSQAQWFGEDVVSRSNVDGAFQITFIDPAHSAPSGGFVTGWRLYANDPGDVVLQVFRPVATGYQLIGQNAVSVFGTGFVEIPIAEADRIAIEAGNLLGFRYQGSAIENQVIAFDFWAGSQVWTPWPHPDGAVPVGGVLDYSLLSG